MTRRPNADRALISNSYLVDLKVCLVITKILATVSIFYILESDILFHLIYFLSLLFYNYLKNLHVIGVVPFIVVVSRCCCCCTITEIVTRRCFIRKVFLKIYWIYFIKTDSGTGVFFLWTLRSFLKNLIEYLRWLFFALVLLNSRYSNLTWKIKN